MPTSTSPYCSRCTEKVHGGRPHHFHETNEHDAWWEAQQNKEQ